MIPKTIEIAWTTRIAILLMSPQCDRIGEYTNMFNKKMTTATFFIYLSVSDRQPASRTIADMILG